MTAEEWDACADPQRMLLVMWERDEHRRCRLVACACLRATPAVVSHGHAVLNVELAERFADGMATDDEREVAREDVEGSPHFTNLGGNLREAIRSVLAESLSWPGPAFDTVDALMGFNRDTLGDEGGHFFAQLVQDIFGNPFRPVVFDPAWRTSDAVALARGIYEERAFDRMPILADALQDAGCDNDDILNHCRDTATPHARGCWVVDLVLGKV